MKRTFLKNKRAVIFAVLIFLLGTLAGGLVVLTTPLRFANLVEPQINEIAPQTFYQEFTANPNNYIFIDVRTNEDYVAGHAPGAINVPLEQLYTVRHYLPKSGKTIALICNHAQASGVAFSYLQHFGFYNIIRVTGGMQAWKADGLPVVTGTSAYATTTSLLSTNGGLGYTGKTVSICA